jgi:hypothetical protein
MANFDFIWLDVSRFSIEKIQSIKNAPKNLGAFSFLLFFADLLAD